MLIGLLFWMLTLLGCGYAVAAGAKDGRWACALLIGASVLSIPAAHIGHRWNQTEYAILVVDAVLLLGLIALMLKSDRFFPIWMAGFQLASVATHFSTIIVPGFTPGVYRGLESVWALPITLSMVLGIFLDRRVSLPTVQKPKRG
jgi:hypothetical protein